MAQIAVLAVMAVGALAEGSQKRKLNYQQAGYLTEAGHRRMAATTAEVGELQREKEHMESRAQAVAAKSGAGVSDPTVVKLMADLNAEGEYNKLMALYTGSSEAEGMYQQADVARKQGELALQQGYLNAATTVISGYMGGTDFSSHLKVPKYLQATPVTQGGTQTRRA